MGNQYEGQNFTVRRESLPVTELQSVWVITKGDRSSQYKGNLCE